MASLGQTFMQGWETQPWQLSVIRTCFSGHALQAKVMMFTNGSSKYFWSVAASRMRWLRGSRGAPGRRSMPRASLTRAATTARSRNTSLRCRAISPGMMR